VGEENAEVGLSQLRGHREITDIDHFDRLTDEELLAATRRDPEAFGAFYRRHEKAMLVFFLRRTGRADLAADLTAEVFAGALCSSRRFRPGATPAVGWLYGIAKNKLASSKSRGKVEEGARRRLPLEPLRLTDEAIERVEELTDAARDAARLTDLLASLPPDQREAVRSHILEERDYEEMASELECSKAVIRQRVSRGLRALRTGFEEEAP
jgi:RNA polymerase sigma-70 factor (ECF subfamily)